MDHPSNSVTLRDIARRLGICHATVSLALRNDPQISLARRKEVHSTARAMGYFPNAMASALGQQRHQRRTREIHSEIAWINTWERPEQLRAYREFDLYWKGAFQAAEKHGYQLEEFTRLNYGSASRLEAILDARNIKGLLIPPQRGVPVGWDAFRWEKFSAVRFGYSVRRPSCHGVTSNQLTNALLACEAIGRRGYERIGYVTNAFATNRCKAGFLLAQVELPKDRRLAPLTLTLDERNDADLRMLARWLERERPDAILTDMAPLREMLEELGKGVPQSIGLAALSVLDGNADAGIYQNSEEVGRVAMETLISLIHFNNRGIPAIRRELLVEGCWVDGESLPPRVQTG